MAKRVVITIQNIKESAVNFLFLSLISIAKVLIFIGEWTQQIILSPILLLLYLYRFFTYSNQKDSAISQESTKPFIERATRALLNIISYIFKSVFFAILLIGKGFLQLFYLLYLAVIRSPLYFYYFVNEIIFYVYSFLRGILRFVILFYTYLTGPFFRSFVYGFIAALIVISLYQGYVFVQELPSPNSIGKINFAQSTHLYDRNGKLLYEIYRDINRTSIRAEELPPYVVQATIAIEDKNFYSHKGISFFGGILRAAKETIRTNELQGGSTITQQLVKSALLSPERTIERKLKEIALAVWSEQLYTKDEIMEMYLNQVPYGGSSYGIEEASEIYFGKSARYLTLDEAALLAGLPRAPSIYSPYINPDLAKQRRNDVLWEMAELGYITKEDRDNALLANVEVVPPKTNIRAPHFVFYTRSQLEEEFGTKRVEEGGFNVTTTLDLEIQTKAEEILNEELEKIEHLNVTNGGIIVLNPQTGGILAMVGSRDYFENEDGAFNVTTALRQPGSTLKPMLYAMALEQGYTAATPIDDSPIVFSTPNGDAYRPVNYDNSFHGSVPLRYALSNSYNIPAVKTLNVLGVQSFVDYAREMGIDTWKNPERFGLSLGLGGGEVTLIDLAQVYTVFATGGYKVEPTPFYQIQDDKGRVIAELSREGTRVLDEGIAYIISDIISDNEARLPAFGPNSALEIAGHTVAVKTGTTNDKKDNLTVGFTPEYLVAVWVGNNDNTPMHPTLTSGVTGAAPIWNKVMTYLLEEKGDGKWFNKPSSVVSRPCYAGKPEYFLVGTEQKGYCYDAIIKPDKEDKTTEAKRVE